MLPHMTPILVRLCVVRTLVCVYVREWVCAHECVYSCECCVCP